MTDREVRFERNEDERRYEMHVDGEYAGFAEFRLRPEGRIVFTHTVVFPGREGQGLGSAIARHVIEDAIARGERIVPRCPFIAAYLRRHREYDESIEWPEGVRATEGSSGG
ncbi:GNAT family N-acetyltransferase [Agromyces arachidis]|uniref:GNAT family N-acetyltransferase n=1 Tax=Agromyces arachidis TaxID=766966 RepID=UPI004055BCFF